MAGGLFSGYISDAVPGPANPLIESDGCDSETRSTVAADEKRRMTEPAERQLVRTAPERCRVCYTCVRECPAKAIRIADGQAEVVAERCVGCGNCVRVCSQGAKCVEDGTGPVRALLDSPARVAAIVAPSFPAEFDSCEYENVVGMLRALGFDSVFEVGFGADLVAKAYRRMLDEGDGTQRRIAATCPAIVGYVQRYHPALAENLAPIVSPMIAMARVVRSLDSEQTRIVFIGPCIAKKGEARDTSLAGEVDEVLTFAELRQMLDAEDIAPDSVSPSDFDPPHAGQGALFAISRGLFQAADIKEDLIDNTVVATDGCTAFVEALREFETGDLDAKLLEVLCCTGCIMGAGVSRDTPLFGRRSRVSRYVRNRCSRFDQDQWNRQLNTFAGIDLRRTYIRNDQRIPTPTDADLREILERLGKSTIEDELNCGACGYDTCREHAIAIFKGMAETEMCLPYTIEELRSTVDQLADSHQELADTQDALMHSERLASMGQLAAGVAHEVNNPLGVVLMYSHILLEQAQKYPDLQEDFQMIAEQADRCKKIVARLLDFARQNKVVREPADIRELVDRCIRAVPSTDGVQVTMEHSIDDPIADVDVDQLAQVLTNLVSNGLAAMPDGGKLTITTKGDDATVTFLVHDTGIGIADENLPKIFEPFFTTKQIGKGTGLGLSVTYGIVKMHRGDIHVSSNADPAEGPTWTTFRVTLPRRASVD